MFRDTRFEIAGKIWNHGNEIRVAEGAEDEIETQVAKEDIVEKIKYKKNRSSNGAFTACTAGISLLETMTDAAENVGKMATILLSTARSSFDEFQDARKSGQSLCRTVKSISRGRAGACPNIRGEMTASSRQIINFGKCNFSFRGFLREKHETNNLITQNPQRKDANAPNN